MLETDCKFIHLRNHSAYSLAEGAIRIPDFVALSQDHGMPAVGITDTNNLFGAMEFSDTMLKAGIQPIIGTQLTVSLSEQASDKLYQIVLLSQSERGYRNLSAIISAGFLETESGFKPQFYLPRLAEYAEGLICLTGGYEGPVDTLVRAGEKELARTTLEQLHTIFGDRLYVEIMRHDLPEKEAAEPVLIEWAYELNIPLVATNNCFFPKQEMVEAHDALLCIADGRYVNEKDRRRETLHHYFKSPRDMVAMFEDLPEAIQNTVTIARRCAFKLDHVDPILPKFDTGEGRTEEEELTYQAKKGLEERLQKYVFTADMSDAQKEEKRKEYFDRLDYELDIINKMGFSGYFLIVADFIKWAKSKNIPVGPGRGSGAASIIAWSILITDLDPIYYGLLFERFLNPERVSMPDFDVDFCQDRRDEVIAYVQQKYGKDRVAQIITFGKLQARAVVRDVGRVLQMPYGQVDKIAKLIPNNPANPTTLQEAMASEAELRELKRSDENVSKLIDIALQLEGLYRHASTHAAGVVIGDRPLHEIVPLYRDPKSDMPVTQFNLKSVEKAGLVKFDFLGLKTLTVLKKAVDIVEKERGEKIDLLAIPLDDTKSFTMLAAGDNTGVFQLESAGMRDAGKQMKLETLEEIIALVALYRPGPMDNIPKFIACKHGHEEQDFMHPLLEPILKETFGIMIYQEQVMQAAQILSGYTLGGADLLRRAMGKKIKEEMDDQREIFVKGAKEHNQVSSEKASTIFDQIAKFAGYGFNKAHAAAYALVSYQTAYMKANYPMEFMAAIMTLDMGNTDKLNIFRQECNRMGIEVLPPDINYSEVEFSVETAADGSKAVRYALGAIKGVGAAAMSSVIQERKESGLFKDIIDFASRNDSKVMNKRQLESLCKAGAFDSLDGNRARVFHSIETLVQYSSSLNEEKSSGQESLFGGGGQDIGAQNLPKLSTSPDWDILEKLQHEFDAIGFYLSAHPLDSEQDKLKEQGVLTWAEIVAGNYDVKGRIRMAGVVMKRQEKISAKGNRFAFVQLSDTSGVYEGILFSEILAQSRSLLEGGSTVLLHVDVQRQSGEDLPRLTFQSVSALDAVFEKSVFDLTLELANDAPIAHIAQTIGKPGAGKSVVTLKVRTQKGQIVTMELPDKYHLPPQAVRSLKSHEGIVNLTETRNQFVS